jgi:alkylation response protein AidB-like acyl-CoA dehydrogenase
MYLVATNKQVLFLVNAEHIQRRGLTTIDKTRSTCELTFDQTEAELVSDNPEVFDRALDIGRIMLAADTLGAAQNMLDQAVAYAKQREQFDRPIATFQAVKHMCAEMAAQFEPCRSMVWYAAHAFDELPAESRLTACHTKAHLSEVGKFVAKTATEVHGGMGFTDLVGLHYWFKRIGFNRQILGAPELLREEAARLQGLVA